MGHRIFTEDNYVTPQWQWHVQSAGCFHTKVDNLRTGPYHTESLLISRRVRVKYLRITTENGVLNSIPQRNKTK